MITDKAIRYNIENVFNQWSYEKRSGTADPNEKWWGILKTNNTQYEIAIWLKGEIVHYTVYSWQEDREPTSEDVIETGTLGLVFEEHMFHYNPKD